MTRADVADSFGQLKRSIAHAREVPGLWRFLFGRFFYSDAVNTVIVVMSVVVVKTMGLSEATANVVLLLLTLVAIVMSFVWGWLVDRNGPKRTLVWVLVSWAVGLILGGIAIGFGQAGLVPFLVAGAILGSGLGGVQVADRVLMVRLSPPDRIGEFFGIYGLVGKGSQVVGQLLYGALIFLLLDRLGNGAYQVAVLSLLVTMLIGLWLVWPVSDRWAGSGEVVAGGDASAERAAAAPGAGSGAARRPPLGRVSRRSRPGWARRHAQAEPIIASSVDRRGVQPRSSPARAFEATRTGGSPGRRGPTVCGIGPADDRLGRAHDLPHREARSTSRGCTRAAGSPVAAPPAPRSPGRARRGARRRGPRRGCSRGSACRRASGSPRRTPSARGRPRPRSARWA